MDDACLDDHSRTIIHIDIDCFYAQVEMIKNPELRNIPFAVNQKSYIVTSNYIAREHGLKKMMLVQDAKKVCPNLHFINGEDLHDYRQMSYKVTNLIQSHYKYVERLALDENYIDVSDEVKNRLGRQVKVELVGNAFGELSDLCGCGCTERIKIGTVIAQELRDEIKTQLQLTTCAGIAHNKLLAKLVGGINRPDQQTASFPNNAAQLMLSLNSFSKIPGIGHKCVEDLKSIGITSIEDLQDCEFNKLSTLFGQERAQTLYDMSFGLDFSSVKPSGKPQSIGIEDCKPLKTNLEVTNKLQELLNRVLILVAEDGRIPSVIKITARPIDKTTGAGTRKTKQGPISPSLFTGDIAKLPELNVKKIMTIITQLFSKLVDISKPFHLTLLGISFNKFIDKSGSKGNLAYFLGKKSSKQFLDVNQSCNKSNENIEMNRISSDEDTLQNHSHKVTPLNSKEHILDNLYSNTLSPTIIPCPPHIDESIFRELPLEIQKELSADFESSQVTITRPSKKMKPNSIKEYFVRK